MLEADLKDRLAEARAGTVKDADAKASKWALLITAAKDPRGVKAGLGSVSDTRVGPLTYSRWNQSYVYQGSSKLACYNYYTPPYTAGSYQNYYCGCVATALAQLMYYHKYPQTGVGQVTCSIHSDGTAYTDKTRGGNGAGGPYDWVNMPPDPAGLAKAGRLNTTQRSAVGSLCHDAAMASKMSFTEYSSSASLCWSKGTHPLQTVFKYANVDSPWVADTTTFSKGDMNTALNPSLDAGLPCAIAIRNDGGGGHAVVVDGYGYAYGSLYHHLNMGWGGTDTAWYNLPTVKDVQNSPYFRVTGLVFNVHPTLPGISIISGRVLNLAGQPMAGVKVVAKHTGGTLPNKTTYTNGKGIYAIKAPTGEWTVKASTGGVGFKPASKTVSIGYTTVRNSWGANFKAVTRIQRLSAATLAFGKVPVDTTTTQALRIYNDGSTTLTVTGIDCPDGFWAAPTAFTVAPGAGVKVTVNFNPSGAILYGGSLVIRSDRTSGPNTVTLSGKGIGTGTGLPGMALIPAGDFTMGDTFTEGSSTEWPAHTVTVGAFYMGRREVTKLEWDQVRSWALTNGYTDLAVGFGKAGTHPVTEVKWNDCAKWCNARSEMEGKTPVYYRDGGFTSVFKTGTDYLTTNPNLHYFSPFANWDANGYRLPTEAEWEKAARGGLSGKRFPWGNTISHTLANYYGNTVNYVYDGGPNGYHSAYLATQPCIAPVGSFGANGYGLYDMAGNVEEWCWDWEGKAYTSLSEVNPRGPGNRGTVEYTPGGGAGIIDGSVKGCVIRGGSWQDDAYENRLAKRNVGYLDGNYWGTSSGTTLGFRVAATATP